MCIAVRLPFVLQYASHLYRSTFGENLGGCGRRDVPHLRAQDFYTVLALNCQKCCSTLPALEVFTNQSPRSALHKESETVLFETPV